MYLRIEDVSLAPFTWRILFDGERKEWEAELIDSKLLITTVEWPVISHFGSENQI